MTLGGMTDGVENVLDEDILMDIDQRDEWEEPTVPYRRVPVVEEHPMPKYTDAWF